MSQEERLLHLLYEHLEDQKVRIDFFQGLILEALCLDDEITCKPPNGKETGAISSNEIAINAESADQLKIYPATTSSHAVSSPGYKKSVS